MSDITHSSKISENVAKESLQKMDEPVPIQDTKDNMNVSTDWETDSASDSKKKNINDVNAKKTQVKSNKNDSNSDSSNSAKSCEIKNNKVSKTARERAFKKLDLASNDPNLVEHMSNRRELSKKLEEDPDFRDKYIKEQRLRNETNEDSCADSSEMNKALKHISKLQGNNFDEESVDKNLEDEQNQMEGISDDGSVHASYFESQDGYKKKKCKKHIFIKKLVVKNLVIYL